jgi:hypothetical protein
MSSDTALSLRYNDTEVLFDRDTGMGSLTAMFDACGRPKNKDPHLWLRGKQAQAIIEALTDQLKPENFSGLKSDLVQTRQGNAGGTWAHWQIATIYAHYLNPAFYLAWNAYARAYLEGQRIDSARLEALEARVALLEAPKQPKRQPVTAERVLAALEQLGGQAMANQIYVMLLPDVTVEQLMPQLRKLKRAGLIAQYEQGYAIVRPLLNE